MKAVLVIVTAALIAVSVIAQRVGDAIEGAQAKRAASVAAVLR